MIDRIGYLQPDDVADSTGTGAVAGRDVGAASPTDLIDRGTGDGRYAQIGTALQLGSFTVTQLNGGTPSPTTPGLLAYCSDESGGAVPVFSDGTNWRRVTDRAIVT